MPLPFAHYTDEELLSLLLTKDSLTDMELELSHRLEAALETIAELEDGDDA
jgi:hypothetical protein